jgi:hypothetical protein
MAKNRIPSMDDASLEELFSVLWLALRAQTKGYKKIEDTFFTITGHILNRHCNCGKKHPRFSAQYIDKKYALEKERIMGSLAAEEGFDA